MHSRSTSSIAQNDLFLRNFTNLIMLIKYKPLIKKIFQKKNSGNIHERKSRDIKQLMLKHSKIIQTNLKIILGRFYEILVKFL